MLWAFKIFYKPLSSTKNHRYSKRPFPYLQPNAISTRRLTHNIKKFQLSYTVPFLANRSNKITISNITYQMSEITKHSTIFDQKTYIFLKILVFLNQLTGPQHIRSPKNMFILNTHCVVDFTAFQPRGLDFGVFKPSQTMRLIFADKETAMFVQMTTNEEHNFGMLFRTMCI